MKASIYDVISLLETTTRANGEAVIQVTAGNILDLITWACMWIKNENTGLGLLSWLYTQRHEREQ